MNNFINDEQNMSESSFDAVMKRYQDIRMDPAEKREVFKQTMLVIEKIEAVSLAHSDLHKAMRPTSEFAEDESLSVFAGMAGANGQQGNARGNRKGFQKAASAWFSYVKKRQFVPALMTAIVFLFTGGASVLAEQSLPGDSLYAIKVNVNEPIREFTTVGGEAKAKLAVETTERRLQEATVLSAQGKLDESNKQILQAQFTRNASQVRNQVASLVSGNHLDAAEEVMNTFGNTLSAYSLTLGTLAGVSADDATNTPTTTPAVTGDASSTPASFDIIDPAAGFLPSNLPENLIPIVTGDAINGTPTPTSTPAANATPSAATSANAAVSKNPTNSLLEAVKAELDNAQTARIGIEAQTNASIAKSADEGSANSANTASAKAVVDSMIQGIRFSMDDIRSELEASKFDSKAFVYAPNTVSFAKQRLDDASSTIEQMTTLSKAGSYVDAIKKGRMTARSLSEMLVVLKIEKNTKGSLDGKINVTSLIQATGDATGTPPTK